MNSRRQHGEPERREGLGGRVRRFVDNELSRVLDREDHEADQDLAGHRRESDPVPESRPAPESHRAPESAQVYESDRATHQEPALPYAGASGHAEPARTAAGVAPGSEPAGYEPPVIEETEPRQFRGHSSEETTADANAERIGLLDDPAGLRDQWQQVQGTFVDDPQRAVREASELVERTLQEIRANVTRGQANDPTSTEDLRVSFQRYREFFQRLLSA